MHFLNNFYTKKQTRFSILLALLIFPCFTFALSLNSYFQQGITVNNLSSQSIFISDLASTKLNNYLLSSGYYVEGTFASDQFTKESGQSFSHTVTIKSAIDYTPICTIVSSLEITRTSESQNKPTSTDESRCQTSVYKTYSQYGTVYGFKVDVV